MAAARKSGTSLTVLPLLLAMIFLLGNPAAAQVAGGSIVGKVEVPEKMAASGIVTFFAVAGGPPSGPGGSRRVPDYLAAMGEGGTFFSSLPAGQYYIGVILGRTPGQVGPPRPGEVFFSAYTPANDSLQIYSVVPGRTTEAGAISGKIPVGLRQQLEQNYFTIRGVVRDEDARAVEGAKVIIFRVGDLRQKPLFTFTGTGSDGRYELKLPPGDASYLISVRAGYGGGEPVSGEYIGRYGELQISSVRGRPGEILEDIDVKVFRIPERNPENKSNPKKANKPESRDLPGRHQAQQRPQSSQ